VYENRVLGEYLDLKTGNNVSMKKILYSRYSQFLLSTTYQGDQIKEDEWIRNVGCMGSMCILHFTDEI
jgi:hypothetical protein